MKAFKYSFFAIIFLFVMTFPALGAEGQIIQLRVLGWGDLPAYETSFEKYALEKGVQVNLIHVEPFLLEESDVFDGLRSERADIVIIPNQMIIGNQAQIKNLLLPVNINEMRNYDMIDETLRTNASFKGMDEINGLKYGIPYRADIQTILYNTKRMKMAPHSWDTLWSLNHKGRVSPFGYQTEYNVGATLLAMGHKPETAYDMDAQEVDWNQVLKKLTQLAQNSYSLWEWPPSDKIIEECDMLYGFGLLLRFLNRKDQNWRVTIPQEGVQLWIDDFCISASLKRYPKKINAAYLFIDYMLSDEMQLKVYKDQYYIPITSSAITLLSRDISEIRLNESFYKNNSHMLMQPLDVRTRNYYKLLWEKAVEASSKK